MVPNPTIAFLPKVLIGFDSNVGTSSLPVDNSELKNLPTEDDVLNTSIVDKLKDAWNFRESTDLDFVQDKALDFFKNQALKNAIMSSVDILEQKGKFPVKVSWGLNYHEMKDITEKFV